MTVKRVFDILNKLGGSEKKPDILNQKKNKQWVNYSTDDFIEKVNYISSALIDLQLSKDDTAAIMSPNCPAWNFCDYGIQQAGLVSVPIYPTVGADDLRFILQHSEAKLIFISDKNILKKLISIEKDLPHLKHVISFEETEGIQSLEDFTNKGKSVYNEEKLNQIKSGISEKDVFTILYTSGTTGSPKGVMITHDGLLSNVRAIQDIVPFSPKWKALSFLPLNHVYERVLNTLYLYQNTSIYYAENFETIGDNCREIHPQLFVAVPRVLERVLDKISSAGEKLTGFKKKIFDLSMRLAESYELKGENGIWYEIQRKICDKLVYSKWRAAVGGELYCVVSGGAALNPRLERIFFCAGIPCLQGYGLTETSVVIAVNQFKDNSIKFGTVGPVVKSVEVKIAEDGEILMKGPSLMKGYYKNPEATTEAIDSAGWFHTGDIGEFIENKFLKITDRKKELFKSSAGKYISPVMLENKLKECKYIEQCMVIGENQKFPSAIIIPSLSAFKEYCSIHNINWDGNEAMFNNETLNKIIQDHVKNINKSLAPHEQLKRCRLIKGSWTVEGGEITPKLSLKRKIINQKHKTEINEIFGSAEN
ncbi:MAG: long-chain fatty acid--CoA ligase [Sphingobacteriaceae bacterium]|nr:long-chain fatty acid--CoA ligase [Sphingobacteriaceae bacterium]